MIKSFLFFLLIGFSGPLFYKFIKYQQVKEAAAYYQSKTIKEEIVRKKTDKYNPLNKLLNTLKDQIEYTGKYSIQIIITIILILMIMGSLLGLILQNIFVSFIFAVFLGFIPIFHIIKLERKLQILITKTFPSFLTGLKTEYQLKNRLIDSFIAMEDKVSDLIRDEYRVFVSELDQNVELHTALYRLAEKTKCVWFSHLGDITEMAAARQDKAGLLRTLDDLSIEIEKHIEETDINMQMIARAGFYVLVMLGILGLSILLTSRFIENPLIYYTQVNEGRKHLTMGVLFLVLPISMYYYRVWKGVK